jgi:hypothetical protein
VTKRLVLSGGQIGAWPCTSIDPVIMWKRAGRAAATRGIAT